MPIAELKVNRPITRKYFSTTHAVAMLDISESKIRFWETQLRGLNYKRRVAYNKSRVLSRENIYQLAAIKMLSSTREYTLSGIDKRFRKIPAEKVEHLIDWTKGGES